MVRLGSGQPTVPASETRVICESAIALGRKIETIKIRLQGFCLKALFLQELLFLLELSFPRFRFDPSHRLGGQIDEDSAALVDDVAADGSAVDDFGAAMDEEVALQVSEDVDAAGVLDFEIAVDAAAEIEFSVFDDGHFADDHSPEGVKLGDGVVAAEFLAFFPHGVTDCPVVD